ncbi:flagellin N-terminal helical domain-containing protein [Magnetococcus sp. PR-3]|uniref:flagellin N-terminal helical domain-containing protein n=1 Tax=Magnetococcus sp. PR-3 TaxID=3120355 RepID=UPI002FCE0D67
MALYINTNVSSLNAQRKLMNSTNALGKTYERLSSGLRINSASDDAAGLSVTTRMTSQVRGLNQAVRNANDGISLVQVTEGALAETESALQRMRELAVQAVNGTYTSTDRNDLHDEVAQLVSEIDRIANTTEFNSTTVMDADKTFEIQVGMDQDQTISVTTIDANTTNIGLSGGFTVSTMAGASGAIALIDNAIASVSDMRSTLGAQQNRLEAAISNLTNVVERTEAARSRIMDADIAAETANLTKNAILQQAGTAILAQANQQPQLALSLLG